MEPGTGDRGQPGTVHALTPGLCSTPQALGPVKRAATVPDMLEHVASVLITIFNGAATVVGTVADLRVVLVVVCAASLAWLAAVEIEQLDRKGYKPGVRAH